MSIIISQDGKNAQKIDKSDFEKEGYLQNYIHENPESIPVYDYDLGFPPTDLPKLGNLVTDNIQIKFVRIRPELTEKLYWRAEVMFTATLDKP